MRVDSNIIEAARALLTACLDYRVAVNKMQTCRVASTYLEIQRTAIAQTQAEANLAKLLPELPAKKRTPGPRRVVSSGGNGARSLD